MQLHRFTDAQTFYERAKPFLLAREADHNLILGLCAELISNPASYPLPPYLATVEDDGAVIAAALRTPPHKPTLSHAYLPAAIAMIARDIATLETTIPGVSGPKETVCAFAEQWSALSGQHYYLERELRIYELREVRPVVGVPGTMRRATEADRSLLTEWLTAFQREAMGDENPAGIERVVTRSLTSSARRLYLWEDGRPVSMAGSTGPTPNGIRVNAVYTPPEQRRRGYAGACVAALSQLLLDQGRTFCFLFTDLANPTSNHIYQKIGYAPVCDVDEYHFIS
jgi:hypothetical protein